MSVLAIDRLTAGLERKQPSFFSMLAVLWTASVAVVAIAVVFASAHVSAHRIDVEKQRLADETIGVIGVFARDMNRARPHEFVVDLIASGSFERVGVYCTMQAANFEAQSGGRLVRSTQAPDLARQTVATRAGVTEITPTEITMSRPLFNNSGVCNGAVYITVARADIEALLVDLTEEMAPLVLGILGLGLILCTLLAHRLTAPLRALQTASHQIAEGKLDTDIRTDGPAEFQSLAGSVSSMVGAIRSNLDKIHTLSFVDSVTNLPNRAGFRELGDKAMAQSRAGSGAMIAVLYIDLDQFHGVNEKHGDQVGDAALRHFAEVLTDTLRETDEIMAGVGPDATATESTPARVGADDFTVLLTGLERPIDAEIVAQRILHLFGRPFSVEGLELQLSASIGVAFGDPREIDVLDLLSRANRAMHEVKDAGRNSYEVYADDPGDDQPGDAPSAS